MSGAKCLRNENSVAAQLLSKLGEAFTDTHDEREAELTSEAATQLEYLVICLIDGVPVGNV